ncbi:Retrotransposable element Tf2 protein [Rhizoctonia solani]|uniref:Retrotransposable element Tf2 protein n=1 Tax=Rhizoctonia solani TaxID=456999 RepID=A0A8H8SUQ6_9AGAM|nr:Retrotransposable element Tf2 protein [Rhizoctonia solani]QRW18714.1 Retrotransposable element Tf2 protein [Rhizoctonia solani]
MATCSRPPSQACSPVDQGQLGPKFPPASPELGKVSLERVICLLWGLQSQVCTNVENISQAVDVVKDGLAQLQLPQGPHTPEDQKPPAVKETPQAAPKAKPIGKAQPFLGAPAPILSTGAPRRNPLTLFNPYPSSSFPLGPAPAAQGPPPAPQVTPALPPAPSTMKVDHPNAFKGKIGLEAKQWLTCMLAWVCLNQRQFPMDLEVLSFLLKNMTEAGRAWAHPHLDQLGSHCALIQTVDEFKVEFLAAFGNPDATRAVEQKITSLTQTGTCAKYITKFRTLQMELNWNNAALCSQFACSLHWEAHRQIAMRERQPQTLRELQDAALIIDNTLCEECTSHPPQGSKSSKSTTTPNWGQVLASRPPKPAPSPLIPTTSWRKNAIAVAQKASVWKATPKEDKGKAKETAKIGKDSEYQLGKDSSNRISPLFTISITPEKQVEPLEVLIDSGATSLFLHLCTVESLCLPLIDLPTPWTITMLDGSSPQAGKIWKKVLLTFTFDGKKMTETFLICNTGNHLAILGLKWLDAHNPDIDWNSCTLTFPHAPPEHVAIAEEEEADQNPLEGVPSEYHQYAKVFGEEEFNKLPPHRHYNIAIKLMEEGPLNLPLYSMTDAKSATLKDWLRDKLKAGKIRPSKSPISLPVMFVPKKDGSCQLVVDYQHLNNWTKKNMYLLPHPDDLMAQLHGAKIFTKLDLRWGYNNV